MATPGTLPIESFVPGVLQNGGIYTAYPMKVAGDFTVTGTTNIGSISLTDLTVTGNTTIGNAVSDTLTVTGASTFTSTSATAFAVGPTAAGANPVFLIDASTASQAAGLSLTGATAAGNVALAVISSGAAANLLVNAKGSGTIGIGTVSTGAITLGAATGITGAATVTSAGASALAVGRQGATNPALQVDASTASSLTGLKVTAAGTGAGLAMAVVETGGSNNNLTIDAMGSGTLSLNATATGNIVLGRAATGVSTSLTGGDTLKNATAVPATAGAVAAGVPITMYSSSITIEVTSDVPTHTRPKGSICINTGGSSTTTRMYINTDGAGTWTAFTTGA